MNVTETAMGVSKNTQDQSGFEYAMAVMKMCDILHLRHTKIWLRPDLLFGFTQYAKLQNKLLDVIHGLTKKVLYNLFYMYIYKIYMHIYNYLN